MQMSEKLTEELQITPWDDLLSFMPAGWESAAQELNVMKGARQDKDIRDTLRVLFMHLGVGCSLKESALRAKLAGICSMSGVALYGRLKKFEPLFQFLCQKLFDENRCAALNDDFRLRLVDASNIQEPGDTGSKWRFHYSFTLPQMFCDYTTLTKTSGKGTGESFCQFPVTSGDMLMGDRGYSYASSISYVKRRGGEVCVRLSQQMLNLYQGDGKRFNLYQHLKKVTISGQAKEWQCWIKDPENSDLVPMRLCVIRKTEEQIAIAHKKCKRSASKRGHTLSDKTLFYNEYVMILTSFDKEKFPLESILEIYRWRWQIELVFKRFKSLLELGHLPKTTDASSRSWLYGKLLIALLVEKIAATSGAFSPWGDSREYEHRREPLDDLRLHIAFCAAMDSPSLEHR